MASTKPSPIGRCYLIEVQGKEGTYFAESDFLPRGDHEGQTDVLARLQDERNPVAVWELNPSEGGMRDVSEDLARAWLDQWEREGGNPEEDELPGFIETHLGRDEAVRMFTENYPVLEGAA